MNLPKPKERNLFLAKQVDQDSINALSKSIIEINEDDEYIKKFYALHDLKYTPKPIKIYIDSYGGYVYQCFGLLSVMEESKIPVHTIVTGCAMSCGFMIAITGHQRFCYKKATFMYHQVSTGVSGKAKDIEEEVIEVNRLQKMIEKITLEKTRISKSRLKEVYNSKHDWYINSKQALALGVVDQIL